MTEGYQPRTADLDDEGPNGPALRAAAADDVLSALEFGMTYSRGKSRSRAADEIARKTVAQMIYDHLILAGFVVMKKPAAPAHSTGRFMGPPLKD